MTLASERANWEVGELIGEYPIYSNNGKFLTRLFVVVKREQDTFPHPEDKPFSLLRYFDLSMAPDEEAWATSMDIEFGTAEEMLRHIAKCQKGFEGSRIVEQGEGEGE